MKASFSIVWIIVVLVLMSSCHKDDVYVQESINEVTCFDGIQNGTETNIDCGGYCDPCMSCNDGIQNGNETGIDCGGDCAPCQSEAPSIFNIWRLVTSTENGLDAYAFYMIDDIFHEYDSNGNFYGINVSNNQTYKVSLDGTYSLSGDQLTISNRFTVTSTIELSDNEMILRYSLGDDVFVDTYELVTEDYCIDVNCTGTESCRYGYCMPE